MKPSQKKTNKYKDQQQRSDCTSKKWAGSRSWGGWKTQKKSNDLL